MEQLDMEHLKQLLEEESYEEAKTLILHHFNQELTPEQKGEVYTELVMDYITMANETNKSYLEALQNIINSIKQVEDTKTETEKQIDVAVVKNQIQDL